MKCTKPPSPRGHAIVRTFCPCRSKIAHFAVPSPCLPKALLQLNARFVPQFTTCTADIEGPILAIPIDAARENRRCDPERLTDLFHHMSKSNNGKHRIVGNFHLHIQDRKSVV